MNELELTGIDGTRLLGFRAALGVIRLAPTGSTLRWESAVPVLSSAANADGLIDHLSNYARTVKMPFEDGRTDGFSAQDWRRLCRDHRGDFSVSEWVAGLGSDLPSTKGGKEVKKTVFDLTSGQQSWVKMQIAMSEVVEPQHLVEALFGPWLESDDYHHMGWDFDLQLFSTKHHDLATRLETKSTMAAVWLANESLPLQPVWLGETSGTPRQWGLWSEPLNRWEVQSLLTRGQSEGLFQVRGKDVGGQRSAFATANP